ncbi:hypothetical protein CVT24_004151 [Panaeolus cyanescens]|uniref:Extracellular membrane protein CFEM domain-containing protein n=1 Tax=Panaeolus cyanescens TaxID=181874 RepID=A0A409Y6R4_9AGAR|nr:hypothetical protein CVT24_004151 [Panaeolus cyanescens]
MISSVLFFALFSTLISNVFAFNVTVGDRTLDVSQILTIPDSRVKTACAANCTDTTNRITACASNPQCLCTVETVTSLHSCETCMLHFLINTNTQAPDFRAGSNVIMGAYAGRCKDDANVTVPANLSALALPATWDGPFVAVFNTPISLIIATIGAILGGGLLFIMSTIS